MEVTTLLGRSISRSSVKERSVVALCTTLHQCGPILGAKVCHQYFLIQLVLLDALQLATGATGLFSQGATAVVHGCSACALGHNLGEETGFVMATLQEGSGNARNHTRPHS